MSLIKNLRLKRDKFELNIESWTIKDQGVTALWGASGSGKTTVLKILTGLENMKGWSWELGDTDLAKLKPRDRKLGVVFQQYELFPHLTAEENILFAAKARKVPQDRTQKLMRELIDFLNLSPFLKRKAHLLSGGEQQRVALARALAGEPRFLILDEPFSALDETMRGQARNLVKTLLKSKNIPSLMITHDREDVSALADEVFRIESGKISLHSL